MDPPEHRLQGWGHREDVLTMSIAAQLVAHPRFDWHVGMSTEDGAVILRKGMGDDLDLQFSGTVEALRKMLQDQDPYAATVQTQEGWRVVSGYAEGISGYPSEGEALAAALLKMWQILAGLT